MENITENEILEQETSEEIVEGYSDSGNGLKWFGGFIATVAAFYVGGKIAKKIKSKREEKKQTDNTTDEKPTEESVDENEETVEKD